jgi:hypothetical protein
MLVAKDVRYLFRGRKGRTAESTGGGGTKALRGRRRPRRAWKRRRSRRSRSRTRRTTARCTTRSAAVTCLAWAINASTAAVSAYGGLTTTRKGRPGGTKFTRSHSATEAAWSLTFSRNQPARPAWSSTAMARAPASSNGRVKAPAPAPRWTTSTPGRMAGLATIRSAQSGSSRCQPQGRRPDTTHHEDHCHDPNATGPTSPPRGNFQPRPARR